MCSYSLSSTSSAPDTNDSPDLKFGVLVTLVKLTMRAAYEDIVNTAAVMHSSDCDWTMVRVPLLDDQGKSGRVRVGYFEQSGEVGNSTIPGADRPSLSQAGTGHRVLYGKRQ